MTENNGQKKLYWIIKEKIGEVIVNPRAIEKLKGKNTEENREPKKIILVE